jgi:hypothetical protein
MLTNRGLVDFMLERHRDQLIVGIYSLTPVSNLKVQIFPRTFGNNKNAIIRYGTE